MTTESSTGDARGGAGFRALTVVAVIVLVAGLALLGVFGVRYLQQRGEVSEITDLRNSAGEAAAQVIVNAFSFHYDDVEGSVERLRESSTGTFLAEQEQWADEVRERVVDQQAVTEAVVSNTAVTELNTEENVAGVIVVFTATSEREGEEDITGRQAMKVDLVREDDQWKAAEVSQVGVTVPVGQSSQSVEALEELGSAPGVDAEVEEQDGAGDGADEGGGDESADDGGG